MYRSFAACIKTSHMTKNRSSEDYAICGAWSKSRKSTLAYQQSITEDSQTSNVSAVLLQEKKTQNEMAAMHVTTLWYGAFCVELLK